MSSIREARKVWQAIDEAQQQGRRVALLTLIAVRGSAYRRPGAKMMMADDGRMVGTLSGGCLEGDLYMYAENAMKTYTPSLHHYDLTEDEMWGLGIGCKGMIDVWVEPLDPKEDFWRRFGQALQTESPVLLGGNLPIGSRWLIQDGRMVERGSCPADAPGLDEVLESGFLSQWINGIYVDVMVPPEPLFIAGAGHDAEPVARLANQVGFEVTILDPRPHVNNKDHFPDAWRHWVQDPASLNPQEVSGAYWLIMNHHQRRDQSALQLALAAKPRYVGVLGPISRTREMLDRLGISSRALEGMPLYAPVGLDLGAETPDEVAVSLISELMMIRRNAKGGHLRGRDRIHA